MHSKSMFCKEYFWQILVTIGGLFVIFVTLLIGAFLVYKGSDTFYAFGFSQFERGIRAKTTKPPAMRVVSKNVIQNNHHSFYNEGVQAIKIRKNGDYNG